MRVPAAEVARLLGGRVAAPAGLSQAEAEARPLSGIAGLTDAGPGDLSFFANAKYAPQLAATRAGAVLVAQPADTPAVMIVVPNPDWAFTQVVAAFGPKPVPPAVGVHPTAVIGERVSIGAGARIGAYAVVGDGTRLGAGAILYPHAVVGADCELGDGCVLYPHASVRERCRLGQRVVLHNGAVVGSDGFGYATIDGVHRKIPQVGVVMVEDDVEVGANATIDRARFGTTRVGAGTKIDNLVMIAHNVEVGKHCILVSQCGIAGSTRLGDHVTLAGQVGLAGHLTIGDGAVVTGQSGVSKSLPPKAVVRGSPAQDFRQQQQVEIAMRRLPATQGTIKDLQKRVAELESSLALLLSKDRP